MGKLEQRIILYGIAALVGAVLLFTLLWNFDPFGRRKAAQAAAHQAEQGQAVAEATTKSLDTYHTDTRTIYLKGEAQADVVQHLPGAETPLDPVAAAGLCASLASMRNGSAACSP